MWGRSVLQLQHLVPLYCNVILWRFTNYHYADLDYFLYHIYRYKKLRHIMQILDMKTNRSDHKQRQRNENDPWRHPITDWIRKDYKSKRINYRRKVQIRIATKIPYDYQSDARLSSQGSLTEVPTTGLDQALHIFVSSDFWSYRLTTVPNWFPILEQVLCELQSCKDPIAEKNFSHKR